MATTATLNGGPTGGLHATSTLIHSENPPQEETCRVDSNSSFESGNDEILQHSNVLQGDNPSAWSAASCGGGLDHHRSFDSESQQALDFRAGGAMEDSKGKKRRKQSRPVRIPATEMSLGAREHGSLLSESAGTGSEGDEAGDLSSERELSLSGALKQERSDDDEERSGAMQATRRQQLPLNLTGKYGPDSSGGHHHHQQGMLTAQSSSVLTSCLNVQPSGSNSSIETDKTEAAGQGTKSSPSPLSRVVPGSSSSPPISRQFSPPLFSITNSSPFAALFPTASGSYFQQHLQQQQPHSQNLNTSSQGNPPPGTPNSTSSTGSNQNGQGGGSAVSGSMPPHRIFNPEAYCDLCNKEFCNKYFLKTHKANKHGVYSELPSSASLSSNQILAAAISSSPSTSSFLGMNPLGSSSTTNPLSQCVPQQQPIPTSAASPPSSSATAAAALLKSVSSSTSAATAAESSFTAAFSTGSGEKPGSNSSSTTASQLQRESFCELCQKEFCNKYFLKRHKAKIHGIPMPAESTSGKSSGGSGSSNSGKSSRQGFTNGMSDGVKRSSQEDGSSMPGLPTLREIGLETLGLDLVTKHLEESGGGVQGESGQREDNDALGHSDESNAPANSMHSFQSELLAAGENARLLRSPENLGENSSFKLSSLELKPQQLGTSVNAENTCQFCFREFPSQQLLRSHIIKKHRLLLQSAFPPFLLSFQPIPPQAFDDQAATTTESAVLDSNGNTTEMDYECNICNRSFQNIYLLRMHKSYFHPESEPESSDPLTSKLMSEAASIFTQAAGGSGGGGGGGGGKSSNGREENEGDTDQGFDSDVEAEGKSESANNNKSSSQAVENENRGEATSDSDDLRRLQTMIMELNRVSTSAVAWSPPMANVSTSPTAAAQYAGQSAAAAALGSSSLVCPICSKEFYSSYFLQQHIQHYHTSSAVGGPMSLQESSQGGGGGAIRVKVESPSLGEITSSAGKKMNETGSASGSSGSSNSQKDRMDGSGINDSAANFMGSPTFLTPGPKGSAGSGNPIKTEASGGSASLANSGGLKRPSPSLSRSYCTICHKELCNKYFMRTHMLKMHGISIESSTGLGGVTCDICNKELCSKYFLKVHKQNTHGIIEDGPSPPNPSTPGPTPQPLVNFPIVTPPILNLATGPAGGRDTGSPLGGQGDMSPSLLPKEQNERYFNHFSEVCPLCGRRFRSSKWLKSHLQSDHGQEGREKWKAIEKSLNLQRRSPKMSKSGSSNGASSKSAGGGGSISGGKSSSGGGGGSNSKQGSSKEGNKCALCGFTSGDTEVMRSHLIKEHGTHGVLGADPLASTFPEGSPGLMVDPLAMLFQKMEGGTNKLYRCSYCPFTTQLLVYLYAHERTHTGLANSVTSQNPVNTPDAKGPFQCSMCFHTFQQPDAFQQHLIGHQMSGVLAPFFTPSAAAAAAAAAASSSCQYGLLPDTDSAGDMGGGLLSSLPLLNGSTANSSLYLALSSAKAQDVRHQEEEEDDDEDDEKSEQDMEEDANGAADLTTRKRQLPREDPEEEEDGRYSPSGCGGGSEATSRKLSKISHFRCTCCHARFKTREACISHIRQEHKGKRVVFKVISKAIKRRGLMMGGSHLTTESSNTLEHYQSNNNNNYRQKRNFRCRKCKFTCSTYTTLMVHSKLQHSVIRPGSLGTHVSQKTLSFNNNLVYKLHNYHHHPPYRHRHNKKNPNPCYNLPLFSKFNPFMCSHSFKPLSLTDHSIPYNTIM